MFNSCRRHAAALAMISLALLLGAGSAKAVNVTRVVVKNMVPETPVSEEQLTNIITITTGLSMDGAALAKALAADIKRLQMTGFFADVQTRMESVDNDPEKVLVTFEVTPMPKIAKVMVEGNKLIKTKKITDKITLQNDAMLSERLVSDNTNAIRKLYQDKGYYQTEITSVIQPIPGTHTVNVIFKITEESRFKVRNVNFTDNTVFTSRQIRKKLLTRHSWWSHIFSTGYFDEEKLKVDLDAIYELYTGKGYLDFRVDKIERQPGKDNWLILVLHLVEGQPYTVTTVEVSGNQGFSRDLLMAKVKLPTGSTFSGDIERADTERLRALYEQQGYIDIKVFPRHKLDSLTHTVAVTYDIYEGVPATIRDIFITGNEVTQDKVIRRELAILPGDLGDSGKLRATKSRLMGMDYFESVDILPMATDQENTKDIQVNVKEKKTGQLMLGAGFSSEDSVLGMVEITQKNFDLWNWPHFTGGGQRLRLQLQLGTERQDYVLSFTEPWFLDRKLALDWDLYRRERDQDFYTQANMGTSVMLTKELRKYWRHALGFRLEQVTISDMDASAGVDPDSMALSNEEGDHMISSILYRLIRDSRDRTLNPSSGSRLVLSSEFSPSALGSYASVYRLGASGAQYFPIWNRCVLKLEAEMGTMDSLEGDEPGIFDRYFAGGANSIRGFKRRMVGPVDAAENAVGGKSIMRGTVEVIYPIYDMIRGSVFSDFGNVWWDSTAWDPSDINASVGVGLQLDLPIGPIRLDYGFPIITTWDHLGTGGRFHFNLGYYF